VYLSFATGPEALWSGNFRELSASIARMSTLAEGGRIGIELVHEEIARLTNGWKDEARDALTELLSEDQLAHVDLFDRLQLREVVQICRTSVSIAQAGRRLFGASRLERRSINDSDRLRKYLARFELDWERVSGSQLR
jgi:transcriptional regulatory protein RtcR